MQTSLAATLFIFALHNFIYHKHDKHDKHDIRKENKKQINKTKRNIITVTVIKLFRCF